MATLAPSQAIDAPARVALPYGLFSAVTPIDNPFLGWEQGATWLDQPCEPLPEVIGSDCVDPSGSPMDLDSDMSVGVTDSFTVYGEFNCTPVGNGSITPQDLAAARLFAREEQVVTGRVVDLLTSANPLGGTELMPPMGVDSIPALETHLATQWGSQGVLIVTADFLYQAFEARAIERVGNGLRTALGTPVAVDREGSAYAASIIPTPVLYRGSVFTSSDRAGDLLNRQTNDLTAVALRTYVLGWVPCAGAYVNLA